MEFLARYSDGIMLGREKYRNSLKDLKIYYEKACRFISDSQTEIHELDNLMVETFPDYRKVLDDSEIIEDFQFQEYARDL